MSNLNITIRNARPSDLDALAKLRFLFRSELAKATVTERQFLSRCKRWMKARLSTPGLWHCWVAVSGSRLVGTAWLQEIEKIPNPVSESEKHAYITNCYVIPELRGFGIGSKLLTAALQWCNANKLDAVILWPSPESRTLYQRHGFSVRDDLFELRRQPRIRKTKRGKGS
jgi:GNAT superfamily N-acetyltransferase